ncbi:MAG: hypothetical protein LC800_20390 [Acidobacteria bacterium]|nr:hypothetical protein [Acidobacteriota bacterium]
MGKAIRASALVLLLACTTQAGWMHADVAPPPPPPDEQQQTTDGETGGETENVTAEALTQTVLDLLADVLTLV